MFSKPFGVGALAIACVGAAAGGAYLAVRQNNQAPQAVAAVVPAGEAPSAATPAVQETEATVAPPASAEPVEVPRSEAETRAEPPVSTPAPRSARERVAAANPRASVAEDRARLAAQQPATRPASVPAPPSHTDKPIGTVAETPAASRPEPAPAPPVSSEPTRTEPPPVPSGPIFEELIVPATAVMGLQIQTAVSSERARVEDRVEARVTRDVSVDGKTAVPAGTRVIGSVTLVEQGGKVRERARLGVRFHTLVLADGTELPLRTEAILREGESPAGDSTRKIGGAAAGGAILGAIIGGKKGAIIGGATGAAGGTAAVMTGDRDPATLPVGSVVTVRLSAPLTVAVEKN